MVIDEINDKETVIGIIFVLINSRLLYNRKKHID